MNKQEILNLLRSKIKRVNFPKDIDFNINPERKELVITMTENGICSNMQTDSSAFEGWAICLKTWLPEFVNDVVINGKIPKNKNNLHYNRFLYRLKKFINTYSWAKTNDYKNELELSDVTKDDVTLFINVPKQDASKGATHCEAQLERAYCNKNKSYYTALDHQLPVRIFKNKEIKEKYALTPGGFIDIWGINNNILRIFELKLPTNTQIGIISELMFYVNIMTDVIQHNINIPQKNNHRSFDELYKLYENPNICKQIDGVFLADKFHTLIQEKQEEVLQTINKGKFSNDIFVSFSFERPNVEAFCPINYEILKPKEYKNKTYKEQQKDKQLSLLFQSNGIFEGAHGCGIFKNNMYPYVLQEQESEKNLYTDIRENCIKYFEGKEISWWGENKSKPTGHLLSSQVNCLNHLFKFRVLRNQEEKDAVLAIINKATNMEFDEVLPSSLDNDGGYIAFEFAYKNDELLGENDKGARRGVLCTSIDAMIVARKGEYKWLIPIEWKYTETYEKEDKTCQKRLERYEELIKKSDRLKMPENGQIPHSIYFQEPSYELMRQTLLCEQLIAKDYAVDFFHINIIPKENTELRKAVENEFMQNLTKDAKFKIIDSQEILEPLKNNDNYKDLITYLKTRYWK